MNALVAVVDERIDVAVGNGVNAATASAVAAAGTATRHEFLAPERSDAVAPLAGVRFYDGFVEKFHLRSGRMKSIWVAKKTKKPHRYR